MTMDRQMRGAETQNDRTNMADLNKYSLTKGLKFDPK